MSEDFCLVILICRADFNRLKSRFWVLKAILGRFAGDNQEERCLVPVVEHASKKSYRLPKYGR